MTWTGAVRDRPSVRLPEVVGIDRWLRVPAYRIPRRVRGVCDLVVVAISIFLVASARLRGDRCTVLLLSPAMVGSVCLVRALDRMKVRVVARYPSPADALRPRGERVGKSLNVTACAPSPAQVRSQSAFAIQLLPNAVDLAGNAPHQPTAAGGMFLYVGRLIASKRVHLLTEAWSSIHEELPEWELVIVGDGASERDSVEMDVRLSGKDLPRCRFEGRQSDPGPYYDRADVFVFPSESEGLPNVMLEAMAHGVPVIADADRVADWFPAMPPLLPWPGAPRGLAGAMASAARDPALRLAVGLEGREFVLERHSAEAAALRLLALT